MKRNIKVRLLKNRGEHKAGDVVTVEDHIAVRLIYYLKVAEAVS